MNHLVLDVEADVYNQAPYNIGLVIVDNDGNIKETKQIWLSSHVKENLEAMYSLENRTYFKNNEDKFEIYDNDEDFIFDFYQLLAKYDINDLFAYNVSFDWRKLTKIFNESELRSQIEPKDIMTLAFNKVMNSSKFLNYCRDNNYKTDKGFPSTSFETVYRYYTNNKDYKEVHRGLEDALDECDLLYRLGINSNNNWKPIQPWRRLGKI